MPIWSGSKEGKQWITTDATAGSNSGKIDMYLIMQT